MYNNVILRLCKNLFKLTIKSERKVFSVSPQTMTSVKHPVDTNDEDGPNKKLKTDPISTDNGTDDQTYAKLEHGIPWKKTVLMMAYSGVGYYGMQM